MKRIFKVIIVLLIGFLFGVIGGPYILHNESYVKVHFFNESSQDIKTIRLVHEKGICLLENLSKGQHGYINFVPEGESVFTFEVEFENKKIIRSSEDYVEPGYVVLERIHDSNIGRAWQR